MLTGTAPFGYANTVHPHLHLLRHRHANMEPVITIAAIVTNICPPILPTWPQTLSLFVSSSFSIWFSHLSFGPTLSITLPLVQPLTDQANLEAIHSLHHPLFTDA